MHLPLNTPLDLSCVKAALIARHAALSGMVETFRMMGAPEYPTVRAETDATARLLLVVCEIERGVEAHKGMRVRLNRDVGRYAKGSEGEVYQTTTYDTAWVKMNPLETVQFNRDFLDILPPAEA